MNNLILKKIEDFEKAQNSTEKIYKTTHAIESIIIIGSIQLYQQTRINRVTSKSLVELILANFHKRNPLTSNWINLLKYSIDILNINSKNFDTDLGIKIQNIAKAFLPETTKKEIKSSPDLKVVLDSFSIIRNKAIAHGLSISNETIKLFEDNSYSRIPYVLCEFIDSICEGRILYSNNTSLKEDNTETTFSFTDYSNEIAKNVEIPVNKLLNFENILSNSLYIYFPSKMEMLSTVPFLIHRDNKFLIYSGVDNKSLPYYTDFYSSSHISVKKYENVFKDLVNDDIDLINSQQINIKLYNDNGVLHNLPMPSYSRFVGRTDTINKIISSINHKRTYLITISGIGGVGKSAITIETAKHIINNEKQLFNYIIWVVQRLLICVLKV